MKIKHFLATLVLIVTLMVTTSLGVRAKTSIIPEPVQTESRRGNFRLAGEVNLFVPTANDTLGMHGKYLSELLDHIPGLTLQIKQYGPESELPSGGIVLTTDAKGGKAEGYTMEIRPRRILIMGDDVAGVFYGIQSLRQLLPAAIEDEQKAATLSNLKIPAVYIRDYPQFSYRGMHLDVSRHFFNADFIRKYLDMMALHKMNTFHWHLTDDQGWRIEIKKYPLLTQVGSLRKETLIGHGGRPPFEYDGIPYGGFYTQEEIREIVAYAAERHITVIPEIELPGHATAALAAYPELGCTQGPYEVETRWGIFEDAFCAGSDNTFLFFEDVLSEVVDLFPSRYIHIGGDECLKNRWVECSLCQTRKETEGLADEHELQSYFINRIEKFLLTKNRNIIGWDEILEGGLAPQATVMSWRGMQGGIEAARMGHDVIMTPVNYCYFDYYQADPATQPLAIGGYLTLRQVYSFNPVPPELNEKEAHHILGGQGNVWTEYIKTPEHLEYMVFPRAIALAEVLWTPTAQQDFDAFNSRLLVQMDRLDAMGVNYFKP